MSAFSDGLLVIGVIGALLVPLLLVASLPFASGGDAHQRGGKPRRGEGEPR